MRDGYSFPIDTCIIDAVVGNGQLWVLHHRLSPPEITVLTEDCEIEEQLQVPLLSPCLSPSSRKAKRGLKVPLCLAIHEDKIYIGDKQGNICVYLLSLAQ